MKTSFYATIAWSLLLVACLVLPSSEKGKQQVTLESFKFAEPDIGNKIRLVIVTPTPKDITNRMDIS
ncbi:hypothetical protein EZS27_032873 [termite gut metagenome]|jgi:hypothetical protein|uniref:Uncharacterized protein n=1 Tax=termite gut metagenome TaxID=433724 RepID=A0A5J4Q5E9_9ZZZZ